MILPIGSLFRVLESYNALNLPIFASILPISLQPIEYEKIYAVHLNEHVKGYTLIPTIIFLDKLLRGTIIKI